jgi:uncharacterized protein (DUF4415 family)
MSENDHDVDMREEYDFSQARRGPILPPVAGKTRISIRIDTDVLDWFRDQVRHGGNYQTLMNRALRDYMRGADEAVRSVTRGPGLRRLAEADQPLRALRQASQPLQHLTEDLHELVRQVVREELARAEAPQAAEEEGATKDPTHGGSRTS